MYKHFNNNPQGKNTGDCTVRAISQALNRDWYSVYTSLCAKGYEMAEMPDSNAVWGAYLIDCGFKMHIIPETCSFCYRLSDFADEHRDGTYIVGTGTHVVCIKDGGIISDSWDSSDTFPVYYFAKED